MTFLGVFFSSTQSLVSLQWTSYLSKFTGGNPVEHVQLCICLVHTQMVKQAKLMPVNSACCILSRGNGCDISKASEVYRLSVCV